MTPDFYYLESDGQVFLVRRGRRWGFPRSRREIPCRFKTTHTMPIAGKRVLFGKPLLKKHPVHWFHKDEIVSRTDVDAVVQVAINRSLPRGASKVAIVENGKVLMVRAARGITKGVWNLPGGFIGYGEHPWASAQREVQEELGIRVTQKKLLGIYAEVFPHSGGYMISFVYLGKRLAGTIRPHPEEIETVAWVPLKEAIRITQNPFARAGLRDYITSNLRPQKAKSS